MEKDSVFKSSINISPNNVFNGGNAVQHFSRYLFIAFVWLGFMRLAWSCEPCFEVLDLAESILQADLIIIGHRKDYTSEEKDQWPKQQGPDSVQVLVTKILKGGLDNNLIEVNSWDGMCPYGIVVDDAQYAMFLKKREHVYDSVNFGCSVKTLPVRNDEIHIDENLISIENFKKRYDLYAP